MDSSLEVPIVNIGLHYEVYPYVQIVLTCLLLWVLESHWLLLQVWYYCEFPELQCRRKMDGDQKKINTVYQSFHVPWR